MRRIVVLAMAVLPLAAIAVCIEVANPNDFSHKTVVQTDARKVFAKTKSTACYIIDSSGREVPSQLTSDSLLLFEADLTAKNKAVYNVIPSQAMHKYSLAACGREYPERADDVAWENETAGYRVYGPATQAKGEKGYGYDIFFKYEGAPVVEELYAAQCSAENWRKVDSLRLIDPKLADDFIASFTYHNDHGKGMDCYAVGPTMGAGIAVPLLANGEFVFPWCYSKARIIDNGPLRFTVELEFEPRAVGADKAVTETRRISLDSHALLNKCCVSYKGLSGTTPVAVGFPLRDNSRKVADKSGIIAYSDPTQGDGNGKAYLGIVAPAGFSRTGETQGHIIGETDLPADGELEYYWGFVWDRNTPDITLDSWADRLRVFANTKPFTVKIK